MSLGSLQLDRSSDVSDFMQIVPSGFLLWRMSGQR